MTIIPSQPHRRYNPLKDEWLLVSPQRTKRPWQGKQEPLPIEKLPSYEPNCYLCPGNKRASGEKNPQYKNTYVFTNDFQAILDNGPLSTQKKSDFFQSQSVSGTCRVVCFSPRHDLTLANMNVEQIELVITTWIEQINELKERYDWVQIFENKGYLMGASNPHPHGQIWASNFIPNELSKEDFQQKKYFQKHHSPLLLDYFAEELKENERIVLQNDSWVVVVPFWAIWPFETLLLPKVLKSLFILSKGEIKDLAQIMKKLLQIYDRLFTISMPYSMGWHFAPLNSDENDHWQLHAHYYPPLLRSATVKKYMVGYEMLSEAQRDLTAEQAAAKLREFI